MLFEKTIRKKRMSAFFVEAIAGGLYYAFAICILLLFVGIIYGLNLVSVIVIVVFFIAGSVPLALLGHMPAFFIWLRLKTDQKKNLVLVRDIAFINYNSFIAFEGAGKGTDLDTLTHLFYLEPYIRIKKLNYLPAGERIVPTVPLKFYLEEVHFTYRRQEDYGKLREEYKKYADDVNKRRIRFDIPIRTQSEDERANQVFLYMTYEKMEAFNRLFELVNPHEFRLTAYEKSRVFISMDPIPGKEYPPEALECMKKINAMYP